MWCPWNWVKVSNVTPVQWCINVQSVFSKLHNGCNLLFTDKSQVWNISNSKKLFCLRNSDTLYCFLKLSKTASQPVQCCKRCKSRQPNKQYTTSFSETVRITKGTLHHQSHSCGLSTVWLCATSFQNANPRWCHNYYLLQYNCKNDFSTAFQNAKTPHPLMSSSVKL